MIEAFVAIVVAGVGGLGWLFRLEGKVNTQRELLTQRHHDLKELLESQFDSVSNQISSVSHRLSRIETALNGQLYAEHRQNH